MTAQPSMSVVIATRNRPELCGDTVASILSGRDLPAEIIVVDQSDTPRLSLPHEGHTSCRVRHVPSATRGTSGGRNLGVACAASPLVAFTDDDMRADAGWVGAMTRVLLRGGPGVVATGRVTSGTAERSGGFVPASANRLEPRTYEGRLAGDVLAGGNMAMHRSTFEAIGGFDERLGPGTHFPAAEDNDLGFRLLEAGHKIEFVPDAVLEHRAWRGPNAYLPLRFSYGRGKGAFYMKHTRRGDTHMARRMARDLLRRPLRSVTLALRPRLALGELAYAAGVLLGAIGWTSSRDAVRLDDTRSAHDISLIAPDEQ